MSFIYTAAGILIKGRRLLGVREAGKRPFIAPGGQIEPGETATQALIRELKEELSLSVEENALEPYDIFTAEAVNHPGRQVHMQAFLVQSWQGNMTPHNEIEEICWLTSSSVFDTPIGLVFRHQLIPRLKREHLID